MTKTPEQIIEDHDAGRSKLIKPTDTVGKDEPEQTRRCPCCKHVSTVSTQDGRDFYFYCQNPACNVERIYGDNAVMMSGHSLVYHE